ncbi:hypothetical protein [Pelagibius sp.]|uniref:hypothetical protein n=1 Tax=Pelagibius sp. TaxID=1931238 RepID=UPI003B506903
MATYTLNTRLSRRTMLAGGAAAFGITAPIVTSPPASAASTEGDLRIALLAGRHRCATEAVIDLINEAERRHGPFAYQESEYSGRYHACLAFRKRCTEALAQARPNSIQGIVLKLRSALYCDSLYESDLDCHDETILLPALHDLERVAAGMRA